MGDEPSLSDEEAYYRSLREGPPPPRPPVRGRVVGRTEPLSKRASRDRAWGPFVTAHGRVPENAAELDAWLQQQGGSS